MRKETARYKQNVHANKSQVARIRSIDKYIKAARRRTNKSASRSLDALAKLIKLSMPLALLVNLSKTGASLQQTRCSFVCACVARARRVQENF